jgi:hypothetical protein
MSSSIPFVLKYVLPDGKVAGYQLDSTCSICTDVNNAKVYMPQNNRDDQVRLVTRNFRYVWGEKESYRNADCWNGYSVDEITIVAEDAPEHRRELAGVRILKQIS